MNLKLLALTLIAVPTISLFADNTNYCDPCEPRCDQCDPCCDWQFHVDWLYWKVRRSDLDYVVPSEVILNQMVVPKEVNSGNLDGRIKCVGLDSDSGFRIGAFRSCEGCCGNWNMGAQFTHFETSAKSSLSVVKSSIDDNSLLPTRPHPIGELVNGANYAASEYTIQLNIIDIEASYDYELCCLDGFVRPLAGVKFASIDQKLVSDYENEFMSDVDKLRTIEKLDMDAYGVYFGLEGEWNLWCGFGFFGRVESGLNLGEFDIRHTDLSTTGSPHQIQVDVKKSSRLIVPHYEFTTGVQLELCEYLCADWMVQVGYEYHHWCGAPDFLNFVDPNEYGKITRNGSSLGFDGLFFRLNAQY